MDNEMIARVVKALDDAWPDGHKEAALKVIKAMREPTEKMIETEIKHSPDPYASWTNMIDSITND